MTEQQDEQFVTVLDAPIKLVDFRLNNDSVRIWKLPQYPLNTFKLTCRNNEDDYTVTSYFNIHVNGPPIEQMNVKISKEGFNPMSRTVIEGFSESKQLSINGKSTVNWTFIKEYGLYVENISGRNCRAYFVWLKIECSISNSKQSGVLKSESCLSNASEFFNDPLFGDFQVKVEDQVFYVSKLALAVGSPILKAMLTSEMLESQQNFMEIEDFPAMVVKKLLQFLYSNTVKLDDDLEQVEKLLEAAEKYQIDKLKEQCEHEISEKLTVTNAAQWIIFADKFSCVQLKQKCISFVCANYAQFVATTGCTELYNDFPELASEISSAESQYNR